MSKFYTSFSTNVQSCKPGKSSWRGLSEFHLSKRYRDKAKSVVDVDLSKYNLNMIFFDENDNKIDYLRIQDNYANAIEEYNRKPSQKRNPSRKLKNIDEFVAKKQKTGMSGNRAVNSDFHGVEFRVVSKIGNMDDWQNYCQMIDISDELMYSSLNTAFLRFADRFNTRFKESGLVIADGYTNYDEEGAPHAHYCMMSTSFNEKSGLPETNLAQMLGKSYGKSGKFNYKDLMSEFRNETDEMLKECVNSELGGLTGVSFEMSRNPDAVTGLSHELYIKQRVLAEQEEDLELERASVNSLAERNNVKSNELRERERTLNKRENALNERENWVHEKAALISERLDILEKVEEMPLNPMSVFSDQLLKELKSYPMGDSNVYEVASRRVNERINNALRKEQTRRRDALEVKDLVHKPNENDSYDLEI